MFYFVEFVLLLFIYQTLICQKRHLKFTQSWEKIDRYFKISLKCESLKSMLNCLHFYYKCEGHISYNTLSFSNMHVFAKRQWSYVLKSIVCIVGHGRTLEGERVEKGSFKSSNKHTNKKSTNRIQMHKAI